MKDINKIILQGNLLWPGGSFHPGMLTITEGKISSIEEKISVEPEMLAHLIEIPPGGVAAPGFIDLQINGAFGYDFTLDPGSIPTVARVLPSHGVTSFLPTIITASREACASAIAFVKEYTKSEGQNQKEAGVLGLHLEGPYLNPEKKGAHPANHLRKPDPADLKLIDPAAVSLVTLAPELPGALEFIHALVERGISVGLGHSQATYAQTMAALEAGASWSTHLFNAMRPLHHREPGIVGALLSDERARIALIADGIHVHPALLRLAAEVKGAAGVTLISDAVAAAGMPEGDYQLGDQRVRVSSGSVRLDDGTLAGCGLLMDGAIRSMVNLTSLPFNQILSMAATTPAQVIGAARKGLLAPGYDADIVILDGSLEVTLTLIGGVVAYDHSATK